MKRNEHNPFALRAAQPTPSSTNTAGGDIQLRRKVYAPPLASIKARDYHHERGDNL